MFLELAFKNILRNKRRTIMIELSIIFGIVVIVFTGSLTNGMSRIWAQSSINTQTGSMQVEHFDYEKEHMFKPLETTLTNSNELINNIRNFNGVTEAFGLLKITGMISNGSKSTTFFGRGIDVAPIKKTLPDLKRSIKKGRGLSDNKNEILLGPKLSEDLGLKIGDPVMLLVQTLSGGLNMAEMVFVGTNGGQDSDYESAHFVEMHLETTRKLLRMNDRVSQIVVGYDDFDSAKEAAKSLQLELNRNSSVKLRVKDYTQIIEGYEVNNFFRLISIVVGIVLFIVVGAGISNSMYMSVMERRKEIGTMKAIGSEKKHIKKLFILEGLILSVLGSVAGIILSVIIVLAVEKAGGISFPPPPGSSVPITIPTIIDNSIVYFSIIQAIIVGVLASFMPAAVSAKLDPIATLREE